MDLKRKQNFNSKMSDTESDREIEPIKDSHIEKSKLVGNEDQGEPSKAEKKEQRPETTETGQNFKISKRANPENYKSSFSRTSRASKPSNSASPSVQGATSETEAKQKQSMFKRPKVTKPSWVKDEDLPNQPPKESLPETPVVQQQYLTRPDVKNHLQSQNSNFSPRRHDRYERFQPREYVPRNQDEAIEDIARKKQNLDYVVRQHYNKRTFESRKESRNSSPIIKLKSFNNAMKFILINNATKPGSRVLDLGCGKGGDLTKYVMADISEYVGIDISNASIAEAYKRYQTHRGARFGATFITGDCFGQPLPVVLEHAHQDIKFPFDVVSMQFCMHYAFETEDKARTLLLNVSNSLRQGGKFIGTIPNSGFIAEKLRNLKPGVKEFGNSVYKVTFEKDPPKDGIFDEVFGNVYNYFLTDAIDNVPEYVVPFESFAGIASEFGLKLEFKKTLPVLFLENIPVWKDKLGPGIMRNLKRSDGNLGISGDEGQAAAFYLAFQFVKI